MTIFPLLVSLSMPDESFKTLVWSDEFSGAGSFDQSKWKPEVGFVRNHELQWYQPENAFLRRGNLVIEARRENKPNPTYAEAESSDWKKSRKIIEYTSASLVSQREFLYGRFEIEAKIDIQSGMWPAIWTYGTRQEWPASGEIDIMEYYRGNILANFVWGSSKRWSGIWKSTTHAVDQLAKESGFKDTKSWANQFHVWRMDWTSDYIELSIDGKSLNRVTLDKTFNQSPDGQNPFRQPHHLLLNLAIGGDNGGDPSNSKFPAKMEVKYVRIYQ